MRFSHSNSSIDEEPPIVYEGDDGFSEDDDVKPTTISSQTSSLIRAGGQKQDYKATKIYGGRKRSDSDYYIIDDIDESSTTINTLAQGSNEEKLGNLNLTILVICLCIGGALPSLDVSIVYTIMTKIGSEFQSAHLSTWLHSTYVLCALFTVPAAGKMSNAFGRKPVLIALNMSFLVGSVGCSWGQSFMQVIVARAFQGFGSGGIQLMGNIILHDTVPNEKLGSYLSYLNTVQTLGLALGGPIGGFITDIVGWRYCFKINILPIATILYVYIFHLKNYSIATSAEHQQQQKSGLSIKERLRTVDFGGIVLLSVGNWSVACILLLGGNYYAWTSPQIIIAFVMAPAAYMSFFLYEKGWAEYPLFSKAVSRDRNFTTSCITSLLACICESNILTGIPQFFMGVLHFNTTKAGLWAMIYTISVPFGCFVAGRYIYYADRFSRFILTTIALYIISILILYCWARSAVSLGVGALDLILLGSSYGCTFVSILVACTSTLPKDMAAPALSMLILSRYVGYMIGAASCSAIIQYTLKALLPQQIDGGSEDAAKLIEFIITSIREVHTLPREIQEIVAYVLAIGVQREALFLLAVSSVMFLVALRFQNAALKKEK